MRRQDDGRLKPGRSRDDDRHVAAPEYSADTAATIDVERPEPSTVVVTVRGELDITTAPALRAAFEQALELPPEALTVDLTEVSFIDSVALATIVRASRRLPRPEQMLVVLGADSYARVVFDATGLARALNVVTARPRS
jgi:anti-sigma B factor antagonist